jgi:hypothetical protein
MGVSALIVLGAGCATTHERRTLLERTSAEMAYNLPAQQVMDAARAVLDERGYVLAPGGGPGSIRTLWKVDGDLDNLEWEILQHLEPQFAAHVEEQVDLYLATNHR